MIVRLKNGDSYIDVDIQFNNDRENSAVKSEVEVRDLEDIVEFGNEEVGTD